jgi:pyrroloquinoline quinone biosynthesis protein E
MLTGEAANADPVCSLSPHHALIAEAVAAAQSPRANAPRPLVFRERRASLNGPQSD